LWVRGARLWVGGARLWVRGAGLWVRAGRRRLRRVRTRRGRIGYAGRRRSHSGGRGCHRRRSDRCCRSARRCNWCRGNGCRGGGCRGGGRWCSRRRCRGLCLGHRDRGRRGLLCCHQARAGCREDGRAQCWGAIRNGSHGLSPISTQRSHNRGSPVVRSGVGLPQ
jgi:hypothetical protein